MRRLLPTIVVPLALVGLFTTGLATASAERLPAAPPYAEAASTLLVPGFTDTLVTAATSTPISVTALPDGRAIVLQKSGRARLIQNGVLVAANAIDLSTGPNLMSGCTGGERGLLGFAVDPDFGANGFVYIYYTRSNASAPGGCVNRVSRFVMTGSTIARASEVILLDNISSNASNHNGGDLEVGNDGFLYVAVGDAGCDPRGNSGCAGSNDAAQDLSLLNGKILRIDRFTAAPAPGNPFSGGSTATCRTRGNTSATPTSTCREIFAYGVRNPWRFAFDPNTGATRFHINDVGQGAREEVNLGVLGANYGWPAREGLCANGEDSTNATPSCAPPNPGLGYTDPIADYPHNPTTGGEYITGGAFVPNGAWPESFDGGYLFSDGNPGKIFFKPAGLPLETFATGLGGVSDIEFVFEPTGWALFYVNPATNEVRRISYTLAAAPSVGTLAFAATAPDRVFDSRDLGADTGTLRGGTSRLINVVAVQGAHRAAVVNLTAVRPSWNGYVTVWQPRTLPPTTSNLNSQSGLINANTSIVPIDEDGNILVYSLSRTHLIVDLLGFFDVAPGDVATSGRFVPVTPMRAVDTRNAASVSNIYSESLDGATPVVNVPLAGLYDLPAGTPVVCVMVTAIAPPSVPSGFVVAHGHGTTVPTISNLNVNGAGDVRPNLVVVAVGADGSIDLRLKDVADLVVDVVGSFTDGSAPSSNEGTYVPVGPTRVVDTRLSFGLPRFGAGTTQTIDPSVVPSGALGISQNILMTNAADRGFITAFPAGLAEVPVVSNGNVLGPNRTRSTLSITRMGTTSVSYYTSVATDVVVDITGYFNGP
ncbi:MAG: PQQ-dependent sugar dehydrogenase [Ilumatobacteraceae bacterium]